jgi:hypothetical protein
MKKILLIFTVFLLSSCSIIPQSQASDFTMPSGIYVPAQAWKWVDMHIHYHLDDSNRYHIQTPQETLDKGWGDCKAYSVLLAALLDKLGQKNIWIVYGVLQGYGGHSIIATDIFIKNGINLIEPQIYNDYYHSEDFRETSRMSYDTYKMLIDGGWSSP